MKIEIFEFPPESKSVKGKKSISKMDLTAQQTDSNKLNHKKRKTEKNNTGKKSIQQKE